MRPINPTLKQLEQLWINFQFEIAAARGTFGPMYQASVDARKAHTFYVGTQPEALMLRSVMEPTSDQPNGVPDGHALASGGTFGARFASVATAQVIIIALDSVIQEFARRLGAGQGSNMHAGDLIWNKQKDKSERASTLIWAAANNVRHVDEWFAFAATYRRPTSQEDIRMRDRQNRSMEPLANVLGVALPITENVSYEVFQLLTEVSDDKGTYDGLERHMLRIGQDLIHRAGLTGAPIGVKVLETVPSERIASIRPEDIIISDGMGRTASSLATDRLLDVTPASPESTSRGKS